MSSQIKKELDSFLKNCHYLKVANPDDLAAIQPYKIHINPTPVNHKWLWASDGSRYIAAVQDGGPTTRVGYIKVSHVGFAWSDYTSLKPEKARFVNPFAISKLREAIKTSVWMLPGSNIKYKLATTAFQGFRVRLHELFQSTKIEAHYPSLYHTLFSLRSYARRKPEEAQRLFVKECPQCYHRHEGDGLCFTPDSDGLPCAHCGQLIYPSDVLGLHKEFEEHGANDGLFTRAMSVLELFLLAQRWEYEKIEEVAETIFFADGLLGVYGESAWLCKGMLQAYLKVRIKAKEKGLKPPLVIGIAKTGQLMNHAQAIVGDLLANDLIPLSLSYRRNILHQSVDDIHRPFFSSRWGQDFIWRSSQGMPVVLSVPFWTADMDTHGEKIHEAQNYPELPEILGALNSVDCALYPSAFLPIVLAHEEASIAWEPGGRLLTEATKRALLAGDDRV
jgi:hypothetical protein